MAAVTSHPATPRISAVRQAWNFGRHYVEMCIAMCIGVALTNVLLRGAMGVWGADLRQEWPGLSLLVISIGITLPMAAWMRFRGMESRPILEMSAAGIVAVMVAAWFGVISASDVAVGTESGVACVAMFAAMLFRLDMYTGRSGHDHHG
jgi:L-lactate permease